MADILDDMCKLTTIPYSAMKKLANKAKLCICHAIEESLSDGNTVAKLYIGIGNLYIKVEDNSVKYKFVPSSDFEDAIVKTITTGKSPLISTVEDALKQRVMSVYKDML